MVTVLLILQYNEGITTMAIEDQRPKSLRWPAITVCVEDVMKTPGFHFLDQDYAKNKFDMKDIFDENTLEEFEKEDKFQIKELWSRITGACYSIQNKVMTTGKPFDEYPLGFKRHHDLSLIIHEPGDEFWLARFVFPVPVEIVSLKIRAQTNFTYGDLMLKKSDTTLLDRPEQKCDGSKDNFNACCHDKVMENLIGNMIKCIPSYYSTLLSNWQKHFPTCQNLTAQDVSETLDQIDEIFDSIQSSPESHGCFIPCKKTSYNSELTLFHKFSYPKTSKYATEQGFKRPLVCIRRLSWSSLGIFCLFYPTKSQ